MKAKVITNFTQRFGVEVALNPELTVEKQGRYYLVNQALRPMLRSDFYVAGLYLGKAKEGKFFPSFNLLSMLANQQGANRVVVDKKAAWLFICGRDILGRAVLKTYGTTKKGSATLVLNEFGECLGFGTVVGGFDCEREALAVRHVVDVGDFLRRER
jgi:ribosome biogenesis protein Nip4